MDIYDVNEDLIKALCQAKKIEFHSKQFNEITENFGKVNYIENLLVTYQQIPKLELRLDLRINKNDDKSLQFRKEGNSFFSLNNKDYFSALELYNKSICFAEEDSENLSVGYANRSAILFEWKCYRESLDNIRLAREANYPERLMHKLNEREKKCFDLLATQIEDPVPQKFQLVCDPHSQVPFIANCLEMHSSKEEGRYVRTTKDLHPGDLVATEEPFCTVLLPSMRYTRCANCMQENYLTLIPCPECTSAMFCSQKCLEEGTSIFHKYECPIIDLLFKLFNKIHLIALRVCLVALSLFPTIDELKSFCNELRNQNRSAFDVDYESFSKKEHYRAIHGLVTNQDKRSTADLFQRGVIAAVIKRFMMYRTPLKDILDGADEVNFFADILFRHLQTAPSNMHGICLIEQKDAAIDDFSYASAAYAFASLLNHSCAPNTVRIYNGTTLNLFVLRPIKAGGILYDNYGYHYATQPLNIRQKNLETQYHFKCKCEACEGNYALFHELQAHPKVPDPVSGEHIYSLLEFQWKFAQDNLKSYIEFLNHYKSYYPCIQISSTEESLKMILNILVDSIPLKAKVAKL